MHRLAPLWVGARGLEFTWDYVLQGLEANANLVYIPVLTCTKIYLIVSYFRQTFVSNSGVHDIFGCTRIIDVATQEQAKDSDPDHIHMCCDNLDNAVYHKLFKESDGMAFPESCWV